MSETHKYGGFYWSGNLDDGCWVALIGRAEYARGELEKMDPTLNSAEQMDEIAKALAELPSDMTLPRRGQRRRIEPAEGSLDD